MAAYQEGARAWDEQNYVWGQSKVEAFRRANPGFTPEHRAGDLDFLHSLGLDDRQIEEAWSAPNSQLRSAAGQQILFAASQMYRVQQGLHNKEGRVAPTKPQSPGTSNGYGGSRD